jgi:hypothetical protein
MAELQYYPKSATPKKGYFLFSQDDLRNIRQIFQCLKRQEQIMIINVDRNVFLFLFLFIIFGRKLKISILNTH